jgi:hypothetical protein
MKDRKIKLKREIGLNLKRLGVGLKKISDMLGLPKKMFQ